MKEKVVGDEAEEVSGAQIVCRLMSHSQTFVRTMEMLLRFQKECYTVGFVFVKSHSGGIAEKERDRRGMVGGPAVMA